MSSICRATFCAVSSITWNRTVDAPSERATSGSPQSTRWLASSPNTVQNTLHGVGRYARLPFKRFTRNELSYLDKPEMDAILAAPDRRTKQGMRDHALLLFLYNSGARVTEAASLQVGDLNLRGNQIGDVHLRGKGRRHVVVHSGQSPRRRCSLSPVTARPNNLSSSTDLAKRSPATASTGCFAFTSELRQLPIHHS